MSHTAQDLFRQIDEEIASARGLIETIRQSNRAAARRITALMEIRTDAFVRLAKHHLPENLQQSLAQSWQETHDSIREILLAQADTSRKLRAHLTAARKRCDRLEQEFHEVDQRLHSACEDLQASTSCFQQLLREDAEVGKISSQITAIELEIQDGMATLETVSAEAQKKLPGYEEFDLHQYLREQNYKAPSSDTTVSKRSWEDWIAQLIDYENASAADASWHAAPQALSGLIREKQTRYQHLLVALEHARGRAAQECRIEERMRVRDELALQVDSLENELITARWDLMIIESDLQVSEDINGEYYQRALQSYTEFLSQIQPQAQQVYAQCAESPRDDEICARMRTLQVEIESEQADSSAHVQRIVALEKYHAGLAELARNLRVHLRNAAKAVNLPADFRFDIVLSEMRDLHFSPMKTWRRLLAAISDPVHCAAASEQMGRDDQVRPVDAVFLAASQISPNIARQANIAGDPGNQSQASDPSGILVRPPLAAAPRRGRSVFVKLAICRTQAEASYLISLLHCHKIRSFAHNHRFDIASFPAGEASDSRAALAGKPPTGVAAEHVADCHMQAPHIDALDFVSVMVESQRFDAARSHLLSHLGVHDSAWDCPACGAAVDRGFHQCWQCGRPKPTI